MLQEPIALALIERNDHKILTLPGLLKVDLPGIHAFPGAPLDRILAKRLGELGIDASRLVFRWGAVAVWGGNHRPVHVFETLDWSGEPRAPAEWSTEEEICRGARAEVYRRFFAKYRAGGPPRHEDASTAILEAPQAKPSPTSCPKCGAGMRLRNRLVGAPPRWDCSACDSSWALRERALVQVPGV